MIASVYSHLVVSKLLPQQFILHCQLFFDIAHIAFATGGSWKTSADTFCKIVDDKTIFKTKKGTCTYLSWVSLIVSSFKRKRSFNSPTEKCLSTSSSSSTTQLLSAFLWACRWKIFSSIVPVYKGKKYCPEHESDSGANGCLFSSCSRSLILGHILVNN